MATAKKKSVAKVSVAATTRKPAAKATVLPPRQHNEKERAALHEELFDVYCIAGVGAALDVLIAAMNETDRDTLEGKAALYTYYDVCMALFGPAHFDDVD